MPLSANSGVTRFGVLLWPEDLPGRNPELDINVLLALAGEVRSVEQALEENTRKATQGGHQGGNPPRDRPASSQGKA